MRSTGAGMGCPDWPRCFGEWIPPTDESELPPDYIEQLVEQRRIKNIKVQRILSSIGFTSVISEDGHDLYEGTVFNVVKAWIEYANRLVGVLIGVFIFITVLLSARFRKRQHLKRVFYLSILGLILVLIEGFLGSIVVSTNLLPGMITVHMLLALMIVCLLIYVVFYSSIPRRPTRLNSTKSLTTVLLVSLTFSVVQLILGTQVRESIDTLNSAGLSRVSWIDGLGLSYQLHRSFSWLVLGAHIWMGFKLWKSVNVKFNWIYLLVGIVIVEFLAGAGMALFEMPQYLQPIHLLLGTVIIGLQFFLILESRLDEMRKKLNVIMDNAKS